SGLLLGNGASMAIDTKFGYTNLLEKAKEKNFIDAGGARSFEALDCGCDFERVLHGLDTAKALCGIHGIDAAALTVARDAVRKALVSAVKYVHPSHANVVAALDRAATFMTGFSTVVSLNYDLTVYWAMMRGNSAKGGSWFKDGFLDGKFAPDWRKLRTPL